MLRPASRTDLDALHDIERVCFGDRSFQRDYLAWLLRNPSTSTFVAVENGGLIGSVIVQMQGDVGRVLTVAVHPGHRRHGLGTQLMAAAEEHARTNGARWVDLEVSVRNHGAMKFYRKLGYEIQHVIPNYYSWGEDAYRMRRSVGDNFKPEGPMAPRRDA